MTNGKEYGLIIFDADGTLIDRKTHEFLPGVEEKVLSLSCHKAIATNQGGPACREQGWGDKYPSTVQVLRIYKGLADKLGAKLFICYLFITKDGMFVWPEGSLGKLDEDKEWFRRKPKPGMLLEAMAFFNVPAYRTLMVGDSPTDKEAAKNAHCAFMWAKDFFHVQTEREGVEEAPSG